MKSIQYAES